MIKAKSKNGMTKVKAVFQHVMINEFIANQENLKETDYITNIVARHDEDIVYDASSSGMISVNPYLSFYFKGGKKGDTIEITVTDNSGGTKLHTVKIK